MENKKKDTIGICIQPSGKHCIKCFDAGYEKAIEEVIKVIDEEINEFEYMRIISKELKSKPIIYIIKAELKQKLEELKQSEGKE